VGIPLLKNMNHNEILDKIGVLLEIEKLSETISKLSVQKIIQTKEAKYYIEIKNADQKNKLLAARKSRSIFSTDIGFEIKQQIFINEQLTKSTYELLKKAKELKIKLKYKFVWTKNGIIYAKKEENSQIQLITNENDLTQLMKNTRNDQENHTHNKNNITQLTSASATLKTLNRS
jgi:uncharacterized protein YcfL